MPRQSLISVLLFCAAAGLPAAGLCATGAAAPPAEDGQWTMPAKNYAETRYSGLEQINAHNARALHPVWTFSTGVLRGRSGAMS